MKPDFSVWSDLDVLSSNGRVQMWINGTEILEDDLPYISTSGM